MFYKKYLNAKEIEARKKKFGFPDAKLIELLIYDYEIFRNLLKISNKFYLKGGAAAQVYMTLPEQRASKDIDLVTNHTPKEIEEIFSKKLNEVFTCKQHIPVKMIHNIPMVTYLVSADSVIHKGQKVEVKVDVMFEDIKNYNLSKASPSEIFALNTEVELPCISIGSLVGDKILTLAQKSIGLPTKKLSEYPKQLYDVARLLYKLDKQNFKDMIFSFENIMQTELRARNLEKTSEEIISHIYEVLDEFSRLDTPECLFKEYLNDFQSAYVNVKARRSNARWIIDSLTVIYLLKLIRNVIVKKEEVDTIYSKWQSTLQELKKLSESKADEKKKVRERLLDELREKSHEWKRFKGSSEERLYLELRKLEGEQIISLTDKLALDYLEKVETFENIKSVKPKDRSILKGIMKRYIQEKLSIDALSSEIQKELPYIKSFLIKFIAKTEPSKIYALAMFENLRRKGEEYCYVIPTQSLNQGSYCRGLIDGRVFKIKTLADNVYANYKLKYPQFPSVPLHPNCKHKVRGLSSEEKKKLPETIPDEGLKIKF